MSENTLNFYNQDFMRTLFPLNTNKILINNIHLEFDRAIADLSLQDESNTDFLPQTRVHASKGAHHLRRTAKLDPFAEYFIYNLVYQTRASFRDNFKTTRLNFGYIFQEGAVVNSARAYTSFKSQISIARERFLYGIKFDIAAYFNSIYQHDLVEWFHRISKSERNTSLFGLFLRQINSGRSIDCLPQGIIPTKILGSHFLKFIDNNSELKCELLLRFMDDMYIFSNQSSDIFHDFYLIQELLGLRGLNLNPNKTTTNLAPNIDVHIDSIRANLLRIRRTFIIHSGIEEEDDDDDENGYSGEVNLSQEQIDFLFDLLRDPNIEEEDAELVLSLLREKADNAMEHLEQIITKFPNLIKNVYYFARHVSDKGSLCGILSKIITENMELSEYQLFWIAWIAEDFLLEEADAGTLLMVLYRHIMSTDISRAKILEIDTQHFGLPEIREEHLRSGHSGWLSWSSAVGTRSLPRISRNHLLDYFANGSNMNKRISDSIKDLQ